MLTAQFNAITAHMERELDGAGYFVRLRLIDGSSVFGALAPIRDGATIHAIRVERAAEEADREKRPDVFVPLAHVVAIEGPMMEWQP